MPQSALHSKVRKAWPEQRQSASCHFMPELRRMSKQHGIPLYEASCQIVVRHITPLIRIFPFRAELRHGQTVTHSTLHRPPYIPADCKAERVPLSVCPADRCFFTHPGRFLICSLQLYAAGRFPVLKGVALYALPGFSCHHRFGFIAANLACRACSLRFEMHFLQILPCKQE